MSVYVMSRLESYVSWPCGSNSDDCREQNRGEGRDGESGGKPNQSEKLRYTFKRQQRGLLPSVGYERLMNANLVPHPLG
jgi:hypothetical protein